MIDMIKNLFSKKVPDEKPKAEKKKSAKEIATDKGDPYVSIIDFSLDSDSIHQGNFELDWNDKFVANLIRAGYQGKTDSDIVDLWFQNICRHVVMETWDQEQAMNPTRFTQSRDLGGGRREVS